MPDVSVESTSCAGEIAEFDKPSMLLDHMFVGGRSGNEMRKKLTKARVIRELKRAYQNSFCEPGLNCIDTSSRAQMTSIKIKRRKLVQRRISMRVGFDNVRQSLTRGNVACLRREEKRDRNEGNKHME